MEETVKNLWDVRLTAIAMVGATIAFLWAIYEWRQNLHWKRAEQLEKFIKDFESDPLLRVARVVLDWTSRTIEHEGRIVKITNDDVLLALRDHREVLKDGRQFDGEQALVRDALDSLLSFVERLDSAILTKLVDAKGAKAYFSYWVERLMLMDRRETSVAIAQLVRHRTPRQMVATYVNAYGDPKVLDRLVTQFRTAGATSPQVGHDGGAPKSDEEVAHRRSA